MCLKPYRVFRNQYILGHLRLDSKDNHLVNTTYENRHERRIAFTRTKTARTLNKHNYMSHICHARQNKNVHTNFRNSDYLKTTLQKNISR